MHINFEIACSSLPSFVTYWGERYKDSERDVLLYDPHIGTADLRHDWDALYDLFKWKNGGKLSDRKFNSVRTNYFDDWTDDAKLEQRYLTPEQSGGAIWNIFYIHCRKPERYPIYDQHTDRAMRYIKTGAIVEEFSNERHAIFQAYINEYCPFVEALHAEVGELRQIDRALFSFGQFLKLARPYC